MAIDMETVIALVGVLGGMEGIKGIVRFIVNRKTNKRKEEASADDLEIKNFTSLIEVVRKENQAIVDQVKAENTRLQERIKERDQKVDALYFELRKEQGEKIEWTKKYYEKELQLKDAENNRCDRPDGDCISGRIPPRKTKLLTVNKKKNEEVNS